MGEQFTVSGELISPSLTRTEITVKFEVDDEHVEGEFELPKSCLEEYKQNPCEWGFQSFDQLPFWRMVKGRKLRMRSNGGQFALFASD